MEDVYCAKATLKHFIIKWCFVHLCLFRTGAHGCYAKTWQAEDWAKLVKEALHV